MTATVDLTSPLTASYSANRLWEQSSGLVRKFRVVDFAEANTAKGSALAQNDTIAVLTIPAGSFVKDVIMRTLVASAASTTVQVGDKSTAAVFIGSTALDAAVNTCVAANGTAIYTGSGGTITVYAGGVFYAAADQLTLKLNSSSAATTGKVEISVFIAHLGAGVTI